MALGNISGISYVVPDDPGHPVVTPEDTKGIAATVAARIREALSRISTLTARVDALVVGAGLGPGTPADGAVAGYILDGASRTRGALAQVDRPGALGPVLHGVRGRLPMVGRRRAARPSPVRHLALAVTVPFSLTDWRPSWL